MSSPAELLLTEMYDRLETAINALPESSGLRDSRRNGVAGTDLWVQSPRSSSRTPSKNNVRVHPPMLTPRSSRSMQKLPATQEPLKPQGSVRSISSSLSRSSKLPLTDSGEEVSDHDDVSADSGNELDVTTEPDDPEVDRLRTALETTVLSREELKKASEQLAKTAKTSGKLSVEDRRERLARKSIRMRSQRMRKMQVKPLKKSEGEKAKLKQALNANSKKKLGKSSRGVNSRSVRILG